MAFIDELRAAHSESLEALRLAWEIQVEKSITAFVNNTKVEALEAAKQGRRDYRSSRIDIKDLYPTHSLESKDSCGLYQAHIVESTLRKIAKLDGFEVTGHGEMYVPYKSYSISISW